MPIPGQLILQQFLSSVEFEKTFKTPGKRAKGPVDSAGEELGNLSGFKYFFVKINQREDELKIKNFPFVQDEVARYKALVNQLQREKKELLTATSYPAAIRKTNSL